MVGTIIEFLDGITKVTYDRTAIGKIGFSTDETSDYNPDSLILICWYVSV